MRMCWIVGFNLAAAGLSPSIAQNTREQAVAIDRVPIPPTDRYEIEQIGPPLASPWSLAFLPDGRFLVTEKHGGIRIIGPTGTASPALQGSPPNVLRKEDGGLLDIVLDPDFAANRIVYVAFVEGTEEANRTAIWKARLDRDRLTGGRVIFRPASAKKGTGHPGGRMLFLPDNTLLLTVGDGYDFKDQAQDSSSHLGKVLRLTRDGKVPPDNPFVGRAGFAPEIWTMGHRNVQGLTRDSTTGTIWAHEHGPRGGDEINEMVAGRNYGWPRASFGIDYDGKLITDRHHIDGLTDPRFFWAPSIAPSGLAVYRGAAFPDWEGRLLVGALANRSLVQVRINPKTGLLAEEGRWLLGLKARIRDVRIAPDGQVYLLTDGDGGRLLRLVRPEPSKPLSAEHPLASLAFLTGEWSGVSLTTPPFQPQATRELRTTRTTCDLILGNAYLHCRTRFFDRGSETWQLGQLYRKGAADPGIQARMLEGGYAGDWVVYYKWDEARRAWVAEQDTEVRGKKVVERYTITPAADRNSFLFTEETRLAAPGSAWQEVWRWTWTRRN